EAAHDGIGKRRHHLPQNVLAEAGELTDEVLDTIWAYCDGSARVLTENLIPAIKDYGMGKQALSAALIEQIAAKVLFMAKPRAEGAK
ncbi:MAG: hypothetical protein K2W93_08900, partial [Burkholderiaceae bacterium]|nr:hypothetical protein [Burkholderiaceae bacterium]